MDETSKRALRYNENKLRYDLLPIYPIEELVKVLTVGAKKYQPRNWEKGMPYSECYASLHRHAAAWYKGQDNDPETGLSHLAHIICNAVFLLEYTETKPEFDDRPKRI